MAHSNIYTKFLIEYDKANITSSYPSLTEYEIATVLDRAYNALIAQKLTGNNPRRAGFETDIKAIEDIRPLIKSLKLTNFVSSLFVSNEYIYTIPEDDFMYYVSGRINTRRKPNSIDNRTHVIQPVSLVSHEDATRFMATSTNLPWMKNPVVYILGQELHVLIDSYEHQTVPGSLAFEITYIKEFKRFAIGDGISSTECDFGSTLFELSDAMAEELIQLAITMTTAVVESPRLTSQINLRPLES